MPGESLYLFIWGWSHGHADDPLGENRGGLSKSREDGMAWDGMGWGCESCYENVEGKKKNNGEIRSR